MFGLIRNHNSNPLDTEGSPSLTSASFSAITTNIIELCSYSVYIMFSLSIVFAKLGIYSRGAAVLKEDYA